MLSAVSWIEYFSGVFVLLFIYYAVIIYKFYGLKFFLIFASRDHDLPDRPIRSFGENHGGDELSYGTEECRRTAISPDNNQQTSEGLLLSEIEELFQNLSFFSPGQKQILLDSLGDVLFNFFQKTDLKHLPDSSIQEIISRAQSYCEVALLPQEVQQLLDKKVIQ